MGKEASQKTRLQERRGSRKESEVQKRERILVELLKCKMWECFEMKGRYQRELESHWILQTMKMLFYGPIFLIKIKIPCFIVG